MATRTQSNVVAVFRSNSDAQAAAAELKANGFPADNIYISSYSESGAAAPTPATGTQIRSGHEAQHEGGITGWFKSLFGEDEEHDTDRETYENAVRTGGVVLNVQADDENLDQAVNILERHNAVDVNSEVATSETNASRAPRQSAKKSSTDLPKSVPVVQEDLRVGKRAVARGAVRIYSRVVEQPVEETVTLREEHVRVERQPVNRAADASDLQAGREEVIEVEEFAEEPVVSKQARVVEEVRISKDATERRETVRDTVRRTEVNVENAGQETTRSANYEDDFRRDFQSRYASAGGNYEDYAPAYEYGYQAANDARYQGRSWDEVESDLRSDYGRRYPNSTWDRIKDSIRYGWDKVTGRTKSASASRR
ncbi:MAG TPA: YsnF/AvaK domain-containing protein [Bryobacteraceae bacterium]|nr:YsnF/AvaK domain-containing protein [Bryobacteraceae bacterium]